jgi:hypothetical protein
MWNARKSNVVEQPNGNNLDDIRVDRNMFWFLNIEWEVLNWITLVHNRDQ